MAAHEESGARADTFAGLADAYLKSPEWKGLADSTRKLWRMWNDRARDVLGTARLRLFSNPKVRGAGCAFPSWLAHRGEKVESGLRYSLAAWAKGNYFF